MFRFPCRAYKTNQSGWLHSVAPFFDWFDEFDVFGGMLGQTRLLNCALRSRSSWAQTGALSPQILPQDSPNPPSRKRNVSLFRAWNIIIQNPCQERKWHRRRFEDWGRWYRAELLIVNLGESWWRQEDHVLRYWQKFSGLQKSWLWQLVWRLRESISIQKAYVAW